MSTNAPATIVAVTSRHDRNQHVVDRAAALASETGATVILFQIDAAPSPLESPLPTGWSGDGTEQQFGDRLDPGDLEAAGQGPLADQVRVVRAAGVAAYGWLPPKSDAESLAEYASNQAAELVLVSSEDGDLIEGLRSLPDATPGTPAGRRDEAVPRGLTKRRIHVEAVPPA
jgi:hypothetical protein